jgi:hypothetical protein
LVLGDPNKKSANPKGILLGDLFVDGKIILKWILEISCVKMVIGFKWLAIGSNS